jgi:hypothetical protein
LSLSFSPLLSLLSSFRIITHHTEASSSAVTEIVPKAIEVNEIVAYDLEEPLEAMGLEKEKKEERKEEKRSRAGPGTIIYPDRVPVPSSISIPATAPAPVPVTSVAAAGRRSLVIITGKEMQRNRGESLHLYPHTRTCIRLVICYLLFFHFHPSLPTSSSSSSYLSSPPPGIGRNSREEEPVLKPALLLWLEKESEFCPPLTATEAADNPGR